MKTTLFPFGARVISRNGTQGSIVRQLTQQWPRQYLVLTFDGQSRIHFEDELRLAADVERWMITSKPWNGVERRAAVRRRRERRGAAPNGAEPQSSDRRRADRRQLERRWIEASSENYSPRAEQPQALRRL